MVYFLKNEKKLLFFYSVIFITSFYILSYINFGVNFNVIEHFYFKQWTEFKEKDELNFFTISTWKNLTTKSSSTIHRNILDSNKSSEIGEKYESKVFRNISVSTTQTNLLSSTFSSSAPRTFLDSNKIYNLNN